MGDAAPVLEETLEGWERVLRTNLTGAFLVARAALPALIERQECIVNISSMNGILAGPGWAAYCTSKAGLIMLTRTLANDYGPRGVRANCVCPGWVRTPMADADMDEVAQATRRRPRRRLPTDPRRQPASPARAAGGDRLGGLLLAGLGATYVNGATMPVDGGTSVVDPTAAGQFSPRDRWVEHREKRALDEKR